MYVSLDAEFAGNVYVEETLQVEMDSTEILDSIDPEIIADFISDELDYSVQVSMIETLLKNLPPESLREVHSAVAHEVFS